MGMSMLKMTILASIRQVTLMGWLGSHRTDPTLMALGSGPLTVRTT